MGKCLFKKLKKRIYNFSHKKIFNSKVIKNKIELFTLSHFSDSFVNLLISNFLFNQFFSSYPWKGKTSLNPLEKERGPWKGTTSGYGAGEGVRSRPKGSRSGWVDSEYTASGYRINEKKRIKKIVNFLIKDLTSIFIKIVLKNKNFKLKFWLKFLSNFDSIESSHFSKNISFFINKDLS